MKGLIVYDQAIKAARPGVLVVHEWWGLNSYAKKRARDLAKLGYIAFAIDMYGDGKTAKHPKNAAKFASAAAAKLDGAKARFEAALEVLKKHPQTKEGEIAAIGYCFGGGIVLEMARLGVDLDGVVSFHGSLSGQAKAEAGKVKPKLLVCHGGADSMIPAADILSFKKEMKEAGADYTFKIYPGAKHSFTNPGADKVAKQYGIRIGYSPEADEQSWEDMQKFLSGLFNEKAEN